MSCLNLKRQIFLLVVLCVGNVLSAQENKMSLWNNQWQDTSLTKKERFLALNRMIIKIKRTNPDSALLYVEKQIAFAKQNLDEVALAQSLRNKAGILHISENYEEVELLYREAMKLYQKHNSDKGLAKVYRSIANIRRDKGEVSEAIKYYQLAMDCAERRGDKGRLSKAATLNDMGNLYLDQKDYNKALEYYKQSLDVNLAADAKFRIAISYNNISQAFYFLEKYDTARTYLMKSKVLKEEFNNVKGLGNTYHNLGDLEVKAGNLKIAQAHYLTSLTLRDSINKTADIASSYNALGHNALRMNNAKAAIDWCGKGLVLSRKIGKIEDEESSADCLFQGHQRLGNTDSALVYHMLKASLLDSLFNQENTKKITQLEMQYQFDKDTALLELELSRQRLIRNLAFGVGALLLILTYLIFRNNQIKARNNKKLKQKNQQIEKDRALISQQAEELKALDQLKSRFFTNISHELRTPVTLIKTPLESILTQHQGKMDKNVGKVIQTAYKNANKLSGFVEELLELSRLEAGRVQLEHSPTNVYQYLRQLFSAYESGAVVKNIHYQFDNKLPRKTLILIDKKRISKIINNLLSNALKFTPNGGEIVFRAALKENDQLMLSVADTGRGIAEEDLPHVFDRYFQSKNKGLIAEGGSGIGLALAKELADLMGGQLKAESEWGKGSTFSLLVPIEILGGVDEGTAEMGEEKYAEIIPILATKKLENSIHKVLIVEDNHGMQQLLIDLLSDSYDYVIANNGAEAWNMLENKAPEVEGLSLILSDVMMPEMDGYALLEHVKANEHWRHIPMIMLTARATEEDKLHGLRLGVDDYLTKPFSIEELRTRIENLISKFEERETIKKLGLQLDLESTPSADEKWLKSLENVCTIAIDKRLDITNNYLADQLTISIRQLQRKVKALTGMSVKQYVQEARLQKARYLLENRVFNTITEVTYASGFNTPGYFSRIYEKHFGKRPASYLE